MEKVVILPNYHDIGGGRLNGNPLSIRQGTFAGNMNDLYEHKTQCQKRRLEARDY